MRRNLKDNLMRIVEYQKLTLTCSSCCFITFYVIYLVVSWLNYILREWHIKFETNILDISTNNEKNLLILCSLTKMAMNINLEKYLSDYHHGSDDNVAKKLILNKMYNTEGYQPVCRFIFFLLVLFLCLFGLVF